MQGWAGWRGGSQSRESSPLLHLFRDMDPPLLPVQLPPHKVPKDRAGDFGHCGNRSAEKWVGVILQHKECVRMATPSLSNSLPLSWPTSLPPPKREWGGGARDREQGSLDSK